MATDSEMQYRTFGGGAVKSSAGNSVLVMSADNFLGMGRVPVVEVQPEGDRTHPLFVLHGQNGVSEDWDGTTLTLIGSGDMQGIQSDITVRVSVGKDFLHAIFSATATPEQGDPLVIQAQVPGSYLYLQVKE